MFAQGLFGVLLVYGCCVDIVPAAEHPDRHDHHPLRRNVDEHGNKHGCDLSQVHAQEDFNSTRYSGLWSELMWVAPIEEKALDTTDFWMELSDANNQGVMHGEFSGRDNATGQCYGAFATMSKTDTSGVFHLKFGSSDAVTLCYILETDYNTYANVYGCYDYSADLKWCHKGRSWLSVRDPKADLPKKIVEEVRQSWVNLCLDMDNLLKDTPITGADCRQL